MHTQNVVIALFVVVIMVLQMSKLCELVAVGPGGSGVVQLKPDTTRSSHRGSPASDFSTFPLVSNIIYIPFMGVKAQSDTVKDNFPLAGG